MRDPPTSYMHHSDPDAGPSNHVSTHISSFLMALTLVELDAVLLNSQRTQARAHNVIVGRLVVSDCDPVNVIQEATREVNICRRCKKKLRTYNPGVTSIRIPFRLSISRMTGSCQMAFMSSAQPAMMSAVSRT